MIVDSGPIDQAIYDSEDPENWDPETNNPGFGLPTFPGNQGWASYPGGAAPGRPPPLARHSANVGSQFLDGHAAQIHVDRILDPLRGDPDCLYDAQ